MVTVVDSPPFTEGTPFVHFASAVVRMHRGELKLEDNAPGLKAAIILPRADTAGAE